MTMQFNRRWSDEDMKWLEENYPRNSKEEIEKRMCTTMAKVRSIANYYGFKRDSLYLKNQKKSETYALNKTKQIVGNSDTIPSNAIYRRLITGTLTIMGNVTIHKAH